MFPPGRSRTMMFGFPGRYLGKYLAYTRATISELPPGPKGTTIVMVLPAKEIGAVVGIGCDGTVGEGVKVGFAVGPDVGVGVALGVQANRSTSTRQSKLNNAYSFSFFITTPLKNFFLAAISQHRPSISPKTAIFEAGSFSVQS